MKNSEPIRSPNKKTHGVSTYGQTARQVFETWRFLQFRKPSLGTPNSQKNQNPMSKRESKWSSEKKNNYPPEI